MRLSRTVDLPSWSHTEAGVIDDARKLVSFEGVESDQFSRVATGVPAHWLA